jgi:molybdopterin molybdotransferase
LAKELLSVIDARTRVLAGIGPLGPAEQVSLREALGRTLAADVPALRLQPPAALSAMDGYAVRAADLVTPGAALTMIGASAAGHGFSASIGPGETVRIFTGAPLPPGADAILMQEDAEADGTRIVAQVSVPHGRHVRNAGIDFKPGDSLLQAGRRLGAGEIALAAAMNHAHLPVVRKPRIALLATGDELVLPGSPVGPDQIVASNTFAVAAYVESAGGEVIDLGIAHDSMEALERGVKAARDAAADVLVTVGGASVGDHDLVKPALAAEGMELGFWRIAMRPGKPLLHGRLGAMSILGLPGNPVSAIVCGLLFLRPLVRAMSGDLDPARDFAEPAVLGAPVRANDLREDYLRATLHRNAEGTLVATPFDAQDSSLLSVLAAAQALLIRPPHAPAAEAGAPCRILVLPTPT